MSRTEHYLKNRLQYPYYKYIRTLLGLLSYNAASICDVGSNGTDMISWLPCKEKVSIDLKNPLQAEGVESITADFITYDFQRKFDIVTCFQVLEHISDDSVKFFANKLLKITERLLIVSVPYRWPQGACKWHLQDPVDEAKFASWFDDSNAQLKPAFSRVIYNKGEASEKSARLVVVFLAGNICNKLTEMNGSDNWLIRYK